MSWAGLGQVHVMFWVCPDQIPGKSQLDPEQVLVKSRVGPGQVPGGSSASPGQVLVKSQVGLGWVPVKCRGGSR
jgi:hypothetical protein